MIWLYVLIVLIIFFLIWKIKRRGYFIKDRDGKEVSFKEFRKRWWEGCTSLKPTQQTKTQLWSIPPIFAGQIWGMTVTIFAGVYWLSFILLFSLPITFVNFVGTLQKYRAQMKAQKAYEEAIEND